ncbi:MAG: hypothetical protein ABH864_04405 [archaeon]
MKKGQSKLLIGILVIIAIALIVVAINSFSSFTGNVISDSCQKPYIMGENGKCCKDIDEDNLCDPTTLKLYYESNGVKKTDEGGVFEDWAKVCNGDKYSGNLVAYFGDLKYFNSVEYRTNFNKNNGMMLDFDDKRTMEIISKEGNFQEKRFTLSPNECYEVSFKYIYSPDSMIEMKIFGEPIIQK